jgi:hypothetical protein
LAPAFHRLSALALLCALSACVSNPRPIRTASRHYPPPTRQYPQPGPPGDPWGPYIHAASLRFGVPDIWIRAVMAQESSGDLYQGGGLTTSSAGAMGLMQVMPDTYDTLRLRYGLGNDPYEPHDNIFAGTAYIREMYDSYGFPAFLAAYNAGPQTLTACLTAGAPLPMQTVSYLTSVAPRLRPYARATGPLAAYAELVDMSADDLNRRAMMGQATPIPITVPVLPCMPVPDPTDTMADQLNRQALAAAGGPPMPIRAPGGNSDSIGALLDRQMLAR